VIPVIAEGKGAKALARLTPVENYRTAQRVEKFQIVSGATTLFGSAIAGIALPAIFAPETFAVYLSVIGGILSPVLGMRVARSIYRRFLFTDTTDLAIGIRKVLYDWAYQQYNVKIVSQYWIDTKALYSGQKSDRHLGNMEDENGNEYQLWINSEQKLSLQKHVGGQSYSIQKPIAPLPKQKALSAAKANTEEVFFISKTQSVDILIEYLEELELDAEQAHLVERAKDDLAYALNMYENLLKVGEISEANQHLRFAVRTLRNELQQLKEEYIQSVRSQAHLQQEYLKSRTASSQDSGQLQLNPTKNS